MPYQLRAKTFASKVFLLEMIIAWAYAWCHEMSSLSAVEDMHKLSKDIIRIEIIFFSQLRCYADTGIELATINDVERLLDIEFPPAISTPISHDEAFDWTPSMAGSFPEIVVKLSGVTDENGTLRRQVDNLQGLLQKANDVHRDCPTQLATLQSHFDSKQQEYEAQLQKAGLVNEDTIMRITRDFETKLQAANQKVYSLQQDISVMSKDKEKFDDEWKAQAGVTKEFETKLQAATQTISSLQKDISMMSEDKEKYDDKIEATCTMNSLQEIRTKKEHDKFMKALGVTSIFDEIALKAFISSLKATGPPPRPRYTHTHTHTYTHLHMHAIHKKVMRLTVFVQRGFQICF